MAELAIKHPTTLRSTSDCEGEGYEVEDGDKKVEEEERDNDEKDEGGRVEKEEEMTDAKTVKVTT